jgi:hypothetical protein
MCVCIVALSLPPVSQKKLTEEREKRIRRNLGELQEEKLNWQMLVHGKA